MEIWRKRIFRANLSILHGSEVEKVTCVGTTLYFVPVFCSRGEPLRENWVIRTVQPHLLTVHL